MRKYEHIYKHKQQVHDCIFTAKEGKTYINANRHRPTHYSHEYTQTHTHTQHIHKHSHTHMLWCLTVSIPPSFDLVGRGGRTPLKSIWKCVPQKVFLASGTVQYQWKELHYIKRVCINHTSPKKTPSHGNIS